MTGHDDKTATPFLPDVEMFDVTSEAAVVGSMICDPEAMRALAGELNPEWVADQGVRLFLDAALRLYRDGHLVTPQLVVTSISTAADMVGLNRARFVTELAQHALPLAYLSGPVSILKDRWARRVLANEAERLRFTSTSWESDPFVAGLETIARLDTLSLARRQKETGSLAECVDQLLDAVALGASGNAATTSLRSIDRATGGYLPGQVYVIGGRPGMGKSAFLCSSAWRTARDGNGVLLFSLEMSREEIAARCLADQMRSSRAPTYGTILRGEYEPDQLDALADARQAFDSLPLKIDASPRLTFAEIAARARSYRVLLEAEGKRLDVVAIDHMGLVEPSSRYAGDKVAETGEISRAAKILAKELGCCVVLLAQLNRGVEGREDKRPTLSDLRWSGDIEQDADVVAFVYREAYYLARKHDCDPMALSRATSQLEFLIRKNRNGEATDITLGCSIAHSSIRDLEIP